MLLAIAEQLFVGSGSAERLNSMLSSSRIVSLLNETRSSKVLPQSCAAARLRRPFPNAIPIPIYHEAKPIRAAHGACPQKATTSLELYSISHPTANASGNTISLLGLNLNAIRPSSSSSVSSKATRPCPVGHCPDDAQQPIPWLDSQKLMDYRLSPLVM